MIIIFSIKEISPVDPKSAYIPFIVILLISVIREGYEDFKKQQYDYSFNNSLSLEYDYLQQKYIPIKWKDISIGHIIKVNKDEVIPADILLLKSSNSNSFAYMQTANLDGETTLKVREAILITQTLIKSEEDISEMIKGSFEEDLPNKNIYTIDGRLFIDKQEMVYFDISNCMLRNGILKNAEYVYGIVIYTGKETKFMQNLKKGKQKISYIDFLLNKIILFLIAIVLLTSTILTAIGMTIFTKNQKVGDDLNMDYIFYVREGSKVTNLTIDVVRTFASFFNMFSTFIPISVMVCLELCKTLETIVLNQDYNFHLDPDDKTKYLSLKLHENLGAIKYIFTDKTGTLTRNEMEFKGCSIFSRKYYQECIESITKPDTIYTMNKERTVFSKDFNPVILKEALLNNNALLLIDNKELNEYNLTLQQSAYEFFINMALNHNVLVSVEDKSEISSYAGSNPDEIVLTQVAKEIGFEFLERVGTNAKIKIFEQIQNYELLHRFEFTSLRKRSSIIVRDSKGKINLYMKGADTVIMKKINTFSQKYIEPQTREHINQFCQEGLRTLCYSMKTLSEENYQKWLEKYLDIQSKALTNKNLLDDLEAIISEIEDDMLLLGVTALEDLLQKDVKSSIKDFLDADINVWMLTGDKLDTAKSIGYSCKLLNEDSEIFKINENELGKVNELLYKFKQDIEYSNEIKINSISKKSQQENKIFVKRNSHSIFEKQNSNKEEHCINKIISNNNYPPNTFEFEERKDNQMINNNHLTREPLIKNNKDNQEAELPNDYSIIQYLVNKNIIDNNDDEDVSLTFVKRLKDQKDNILSSHQAIQKSETDPNTKKVNLVKIQAQIEMRMDNLDNINEEKKNKMDSFRKDDSQIYIDKQNKKKKDINNIHIEMRNFSLIIEGEAITECLKDENKKLFYECVKQCRSVVCSRCSPGQKADIVKFIKSNSKHLTLAIGDGGNDVNMITSADIGVGIFGKEGSQAAFSSDFAFSQFKYLRRLLFIHGRYSIQKNSYFVYFYFFKNVMFTFIQFWFTLFNSSSGTLFYDDMYQLGYNSFLTTVLPCVYAVFEEDINTDFDKLKNKEMENIFLPKLYKEMRDSTPFSVWKFVMAVGLGILFSIPLFFIPLLAYDPLILNSTGQIIPFARSFPLSYLFMQFNLLILITSTLGAQLLLSLTFIFVQNIFEGYLISRHLFDIISNCRFWCICVFTFGFTYSFVFIYRSFERMFPKNLVNRIRNGQIKIDIKKNHFHKKIIEVKKYSRCLEKFKKMYKEEDNFEPDNYLDKRIRECVDDFKSIRKLKTIYVHHSKV